MGNCNTKPKRRLIDSENGTSGKSLYAETNKQQRHGFGGGISVDDKLSHPKRFDSTTEIETDHDDSSFPISPASTAPTNATTPSSALLHGGNFKQQRQQSKEKIPESAVDLDITIKSEKVLYSMDDGGNDLSATLPKLQLSSKAPRRRQGRALQARLEKARTLQKVLSNHSGVVVAPRSTSIDSLGSAASGSTWGESDENHGSSSAEVQITQYQPQSASTVSENTPPSLTTTNTMGRNEQLNTEFEATMSRGTIWAEIEKPDKVLSLSLSRRLPSLNLPTPSLFLAVGTEGGSITITELLDDSSFTSAGPFSKISTNARRLGGSLSLRRDARVRSLDFSPDGKYLAVGGDDCLCTVFLLQYERIDNDEKLVDAEIKAKLERVDRVYAVQFSPDGRYLAIGGFDGTVAVVSVSEVNRCYAPEVITEIPCDGLIFTLDWSPDSRYLAFGGSDKCCSVVDVRDSWNVVHQIKRPGSVQCVKWYPNGGRYLAIGSSDVAIVLRDSFTVRTELDLRGQITERAASSGGRVRSMYKVNALCWSPNGSYFVIGGSDSKCTLVETKTFATVHEIPRTDNITAVVWGQQSAIAGVPRRYLTIGGEDRKVVIIKAGIEPKVSAASVGDDMSSSASSYMSNRHEWVLKENAFRDVDDSVKSSFQQMQNQSESNVIAIAFSRGSKLRPSTYFAYAFDDGLVTVRSTIDWKIVAELQFPRPVRALAFSYGSRFLTFGCEDSRVYVSETSPSWSVIAKKTLPTPIRSLVFSKENERLAVGSIYGGLSLLDPQRGYGLAETTHDKNESTVLAVDWSSKHLAVGREDGTVTIFDSDKVIAGSYKPVVNIKCSCAVQAVAFGVSSRFIAVGGADGRAGIYSAKGGWVLCHQVRCDGSPLCDLRWSPTGRFLAIGGAEGFFRVVDTIFWADVKEANNLFPLSSPSSDVDPFSTSSEEACRSPVKVTFSQDGHYIAFCQSGRGARIAETTHWRLAFSLHELPPQQQQEEHQNQQQSPFSEESKPNSPQGNEGLGDRLEVEENSQNLTAEDLLGNDSSTVSSSELYTDAIPSKKVDEVYEEVNEMSI